MSGHRLFFGLCAAVLASNVFAAGYCTQYIAYGVPAGSSDGSGSASVGPDGKVFIGGLTRLSKEYGNYFGTWLGEGVAVSISSEGSIKITRLRYVGGDEQCARDLSALDTQGVIRYQMDPTNSGEQSAKAARSVLSITHPLYFTNNGYSYQGVNINIQEKPRQVGGVWRMTLNGYRLKKTSRSLEAITKGMLGV